MYLTIIGIFALSTKRCLEMKMTIDSPHTENDTSKPVISARIRDTRVHQRDYVHTYVKVYLREDFARGLTVTFHAKLTLER